MARRTRPRPDKAQHRLRVTFENVEDCDAVGPSFIGQNYGVSMRLSGCSHGQVAYRMKLAREAYKLPKGVGFARQYRNGEGPVARKVLRHMLPAIRAMLMRKLPKTRRHPTAEVAEAKS